MTKWPYKRGGLSGGGQFSLIRGGGIWWEVPYKKGLLYLPWGICDYNTSDRQWVGNSAWQEGWQVVVGRRCLIRRDFCTYHGGYVFTIPVSRKFISIMTFFMFSFLVKCYSFQCKMRIMLFSVKFKMCLTCSWANLLHILTDVFCSFLCVYSTIRADLTYVH